MNYCFPLDRSDISYGNIGCSVPSCMPWKAGANEEGSRNSSRDTDNLERPFRRPHKTGFWTFFLRPPDFCIDLSYRRFSTKLRQREVFPSSPCRVATFLFSAAKKLQINFAVSRRALDAILLLFAFFLHPCVSLLLGSAATVVSGRKLWPSGAMQASAESGKPDFPGPRRETT